MVRKKTTAKGSKSQKTRMPSAETLRRVNAIFQDAQGGCQDTIGDSIERRIQDSSLCNYGENFLRDSGVFEGILKGRGTQPHILKQLASDDRIHHGIMSQCQIAYYEHGLIRIICDLYADFATEGLKIVHDSKDAQYFYDVWSEKINLKDRVNQFFTDSCKNANVFIYSLDAKLNQSEERDMKRGKGEEVQRLGDGSILIKHGGDKSDRIIDPEVVLDNDLLPFSDLYENALRQAKSAFKNGKISRKKSGGKTRVVPWEYISLNPLQMETRDKGMASRGRWVMALNKQDTEALVNYMSVVYDNKDKKVKVSLPDKFRGKLKEYSGRNKASYVSEIAFDSDDIFVLHDKKPDHWSWSIPFIYASLKHLAHKDAFKNMERSVCRSIINTVTLWSLGDPANGIMPEEEHFERLADMLQQPFKAGNIIWPAPIKGEVIEPKLSNILDPNKFTAVDKDILMSLGVPDVLLGGKGSNFSNSFISVATTLKKIEALRNKIEAWLIIELKKIADAMGFRKMPRIKWKHSSLRDEKAERNFKLALFDRGILSAETLLDEINENIDVQVARQKDEKKIADETGVGVLDKRSPYFRPEELLKFNITPYGWKRDIDPDLEKKEQDQVDNKNQNKPSDVSDGPNGRPPGKDDTNKRKDREANPRTIDAMQYVQLQYLKRKAVKLMDDIISHVKGPKTTNATLFKILSQINPKMTSDDVVKICKKRKHPRCNGDLIKIFETLQTQYKLCSIDNTISDDDIRDVFAQAWAMFCMFSVSKNTS